MTRSPEDVAALLSLAESTARDAGALVRELRRQHVVVDSTKSSAHDIVTTADTASEDLIRQRIGAARPLDGIVGEEGSPRRSRSGLTWVVDPIDGTVNYAYGIPWYAISVAVEDAEGGLVGVVHNPETGHTWRGVRGGGAEHDGRTVGWTNPPALDSALVATGFGYESGRRAEQGQVLAPLLPRVRDVRRMGAAALDLCAVASGWVDGYFERGVKHWDVAAGRVVAAEAGVVVTTGAGAHGDLAVAAREPLHSDLLTAVAADGR